MSTAEQTDIKRAKAKASEAKRTERRTMRVREETFTKLAALKKAFIAHHGRKVTFTDMLEECCRVGLLLLSGHEVYFAAGQLFKEIAEARGAAVLHSVRNRTVAEPPLVLIELGEDKGLK